MKNIMVMDFWDWKRLLPSPDFYDIQAARYPGWDKLEDGRPLFVMLEIVHKQDRHSRDIAMQFDDIAASDFYHRDWTDGRSVFIAPGEMYCAGFWFRRKADALLFAELYGGSGNWQDGHDEFVRECRRKLGRSSDDE